MEVFEVHITGDESIHKAAEKLNLKTIAIDLLRPDGTVLRTEHMTSHVYKFENYQQCLRQVISDLKALDEAGVKLIRAKIECPFYEHYREASLYVESHFEDERMVCPTSRNQRKTTLLATDRVSDKSLYDEFRSHYAGKDVEMCLYDTFSTEDKDWFDCYMGAA